MNIFQKKILRIILGLAIGIAFGVLIDYLWITFVEDDYGLISYNKFFVGGVLFIFILPLFILSPLIKFVGSSIILITIWGLIGALIGYLVSNKKSIIILLIIIAALVLFSLFSGWFTAYNFP